MTAHAWPLAGLSGAQRDAVSRPREPLLILGGAGSGKTTVLVRRLAWLIEDGRLAGEILLLTRGERNAGVLRARAEAALRGPHEEAAVHSVHGFCTRLLADEALAAGLDPFAVVATPADRLAMLLDRVDELDLRHHDFRGRPAALLGSFVRRIDRLKEELIDAERYAAWAAGAGDPDGREGAGRGPREREFAEIFLAHDRMLAERGALDGGDLLLQAARLLGGDGPRSVGTRVAARWPVLLVDDWQELSFGEREVIRRLARAGSALTAAADDAGSGRIVAGVPGPDGAAEIRLAGSHRCPPGVQVAARAVLGAESTALGGTAPGGPGGAVRFWRCANERTQAQSVAAELERLIGREQVAPERLAVLVESVADEGQAVAVALAERAVPYRVVGSDAFFQRVEIRDVLAWLRLLVDPRDSGAVVRALVRPPVELNSIDVARCVQIARRRKLDMVSALGAATESPQLPPEARERIAGFLRLHRSAAAALDNTRPDLFVHRLIDRIGLRRQHLFTARADVVERLVNLAKLGELAASHARRAPQSTPREFARYIAAVADAGLGEEEAVAATAPEAVAVLAMGAAVGVEFDHVFVLGLHAGRMPGVAAAAEADAAVPAELRSEPAVEPADHEAGMRQLLRGAITRARRGVVLAYPASSARGAALSPSPFVEQARAAVGGAWEDREEELFGPAEALHSTFRDLREELLESVARIGGRLGELRLDTDLDISHGAVRFLELVKLAALLERPDGQPLGEALGDINARLAQAATPLQREIFETSPLDDVLLGAERDERGRVAARAAREEPSLEPFLPRRGAGLVLSASDIETYRTCPLKYKFARVLRIPQESTLNQRFGIVVHQVLERFHATSATTGEALLGLLDAAWRRSGFGDSDEERQLRDKARTSLLRYRDRLTEEPIEPRWFERSFAFPLGPHHIRGRVDRIDALPDGGYGLIDYKTGVPRTPEELREDVQLALYAVGAREAWQIEATERSYYYVLDDERVAVPAAPDGSDWIRETVLEVGEGILAQGFEPTPSLAACSWCDFRIACPVAER